MKKQQAEKRFSGFCGGLWIVEISGGAVITCSSESWVSKCIKSNPPIKTPSIATDMNDNMNTSFEVFKRLNINIVQCYATEDTVRIVNSLITIPITRNYIHSQLFLTLLRVHTITILHVRNYNHLFYSCTFTQFANTTLQSLLHCST
jgi:hypothetical protein